MGARMENDEFLRAVEKLFADSEKKGSVFLTQKRVANGSDCDVLFRATDGSGDKKAKVKVSTVVQSSSLDDFWLKYTDVVKAGMGGLRKKDKKDKKKVKKGKVSK